MSMMRDDNRIPYTSLDAFNVTKCTPSAFAGGTANAHGNDGGTSDPLTLFTVTGDVLVGVAGFCTTLLASAGGGTLEVGVTGNTPVLIPLTTATDIDANEWWVDTTPSLGAIPIDEVTYYLVGNGLDIIETTATANITSGAIYYLAFWRPMSPGSSLVSAI